MTNPAANPPAAEIIITVEVVGIPGIVTVVEILVTVIVDVDVASVTVDVVIVYRIVLGAVVVVV